MIIVLVLIENQLKILKEIFDGEVVVVPPVEDEKGKISSTRIRQAILEGNVKEAGQLLGGPLPTRGIVVHGNARGRTIGYPTCKSRAFGPHLYASRWCLYC